MKKDDLKREAPVIEKWAEKHYVRWGEREFGPFLHDGKDCDLVGPDVWAIMGYVRKGREKPRRCVIYIWIAPEDRRIFFSANGGETLDDAIEVIDAGDTGTGVWAEHQYMRLVLASRNLAGEFVEQRLIPREGKHYDQLIYKVGQRKQISLFFDITSFYGKFSPEVEKAIHATANDQEE